MKKAVGIIAEYNPFHKGHAYHIEKAKELTGADYTHLVPDDEMLNFLMENIIGVPTTFFVDSQGKEVGESVIGARDQAAWQEEINNRLAMLEK